MTFKLAQTSVLRSRPSVPYVANYGLISTQVMWNARSLACVWRGFSGQVWYRGWEVLRLGFT